VFASKTKAAQAHKKHRNRRDTSNQQNGNARHNIPAICRGQYLAANSLVDNAEHKDWLRKP
jgi:hypothetical protein